LKRNLRVTKWLGIVPAVAVCTLYGREFEVALTAIRIADAQESLRLSIRQPQMQIRHYVRARKQ